MAYTAAAGDVEMGREERTVVLVEKKSITRLPYTVSGFLLFTALCLVGTRIFTWYSSSWLEVMGEPGQTKALNMTDTAEKTGSYAENKTSQDELEGRDGFQGVRQKNTSTGLIQSGQTEALNKTDAAVKTDLHYGQITSKTKAAIHLEANYWKGEAEDKMEWEIYKGHAFAQGGFQLVNNQIVIPQSGLYFVYSQASFRVSCSEGGEEVGAGKGLTPLRHRIWRYSDSLSGKASLMSTLRSACQNTAQEDSYRDGQGWYNAIYLGAVFHLIKGDLLWTETNQLSELETDEGRTFFGVFAL